MIVSYRTIAAVCVTVALTSAPARAQFRWITADPFDYTTWPNYFSSFNSPVVSHDGGTVAFSGFWTGGPPGGSNGGFRWTSATGTQRIGTPGDAFYPVAISGDGSSIFGSGFGPNVSGFARWRQGTGFQSVPINPNESSYATSFNGDVLAHSRLALGNGQELGAVVERWTDSSGVAALGFVSTGFEYTGPGENGFSSRVSISEDGNTIAIGLYGDDGVSSSHSRSFRWTNSTGVQQLPGGPGFSSDEMYANAITADGSRIIGRLDSATGVPSFEWSESTGAIIRPDLPFTDFVSADGSTTASSFSIWTAETGVVSLQELLTAAGVPNASSLSRITGLSGDGRTIVGVYDETHTTQNQRDAVWTLTIPAPGGAALFAGVCVLACGRRRNGVRR